MRSTWELHTSTVAFDGCFGSTSSVTFVSSEVATIIEESSVGVTMICGEDIVFYTKNDHNITFWWHLLVSNLSLSASFVMHRLDTIFLLLGAIYSLKYTCYIGNCYK